MSQNVAILGNLNYDITLGIGQFPLQNKKSRADWSLQSAGGAPTNVAVWLHRLGFSCSLFSIVGKDDFGSLALRYLKDLGIDCADTVQIDETISTGLAVAFAQGEHNSMITTGGSYNSKLWDALVKSIQVSRFDHIHCHHRHVLTVREMIEHKGLGSIVSISTDLNGTFDADIVRASNYTFTNEDELVLALGGSKSWINEIRDTLQETDRTVFVTKGGDGSVRINSEGVYKSRAFSTNVVDTTGGGDAYAAGVIAAELCMKQPAQCMELGHHLACAVVAHITAQPVTSAVDETLSQIKRVLDV